MTWTVGSALRTTYSIVGNNFVAFFVTTLVLTAPMLFADLVGGGKIFSLAVGVVCNVLTGLCLSVGTIQAMAGKRPDIVSLLKQVNRTNSGKLIVLGIVQSLVIALGFALIVPGIYVLAMWMVATPAMIIERLSIGEALDRSSALTRDRRWRTLGAFVACLIITVVPLTLANFFLIDLIGTTEGSVGEYVLTWLIGAALGAVIASVPSVLYVLLRAEKDGATIEQIATDLG